MQRDAPLALPRKQVVGHENAALRGKKENSRLMENHLPRSSDFGLLHPPSVLMGHDVTPCATKLEEMRPARATRLTERS